MTAHVCCISYTMKKRIQVSLNPELLEVARQIMKSRKFDTVSEFLEALLREEWERRLKDTASVFSDIGRVKPALTPPAKSASYLRGRK